MSHLPITRHASTRLTQRGMRLDDAELIALIGTEVEDGYLVRAKDYQEIESALKKLLERFRRVIGKRLVIANGQIVTAYHASRGRERRLLRNARESSLFE